MTPSIVVTSFMLLVNHVGHDARMQNMACKCEPVNKDAECHIVTQNNIPKPNHKISFVFVNKKNSSEPSQENVRITCTKEKK